MTSTNEPQRIRRDKDFLTALDDSQRKAWVRAIITRMASAWGLSDMQSVAAKAGCTERAAGNWVTNGQVPWSIIYSCHLETGASLDWIYNGTMPVIENNQVVQSKLKSLTSEALHLGTNALDLFKPTKPSSIHKMTDLITAKIIKYFSAKKV